MPWQQNYDPLHGPLSTIAAALPLVVLLGLLAVRRVPAYVAALAGLAAALLVAIGVIGMPAPMAGRAALLGAAYGLLPIGWIVLNVMFLYRLTEERGVFVALQRAITGITSDRRLQLLLIAFCFGAFFEGAAGFGTPVAVTGAMLIGLGFPPLEASALSLIANTAPVAFGALGTPVIALQGVTGLDLGALSAMVGRQLPFFSVIVPFWLIAAYCGLQGHAGDVAGAARRRRVVRGSAVPRLELSRSVARRHPRRRVLDGVSRRCSSKCGAADARCRRLRGDDRRERADRRGHETGFRVAIMPWLILTVIVFAWGTPQVKTFLNRLFAARPRRAFRSPGSTRWCCACRRCVAKPTPEPAVFLFNWLSASGTAILITAIISGLHAALFDRRA